MSAQHSKQRRWSSRRVAITWAVALVLAFVMVFLFGRYGINPDRWAQHVIGNYPG